MSNKYEPLWKYLKEINKEKIISLANRLFLILSYKNINDKKDILSDDKI